MPQQAFGAYRASIRGADGRRRRVPPVKVWFDGDHYWLSDGFQRISALEQLGREQVLAEIRRGALVDARWDSYGSNSTHGLRRTQADLIAAIFRASQHPTADGLSHREIARHLGIPEATFRRLVKRASASHDAGPLDRRLPTTVSPRLNASANAGRVCRRQVQSGVSRGYDYELACSLLPARGCRRSRLNLMLRLTQADEKNFTDGIRRDS